MIEFFLQPTLAEAANYLPAAWPLWLSLLVAAGLAVVVATIFWYIWQEPEEPKKEPDLSKIENLAEAANVDEDGLETEPLRSQLEELRRRVLQCAGALVVTTTLCFIFTKQLIDLLLQPLMGIGIQPDDFLWTKGVIDPFLIQMQTGLFGGFALALPAILYFVASFVLPALHAEEKRYLLPAFAAGALLFTTGVLFCYFFLLPIALGFFLEYNAYLGLRPMWPFYDYVGFVLQMLIAFGISFELPLVLLVLNVLGIVSADWLAHYRRHAVVVIMIFAACITPGGDLLSLFLLSAPMYVLYEGTLWLIRIREKRIEAEDRRVDEMYKREIEEQRSRRV